MARVTLVMDRLRCGQTTETGHDEFYYTYGGYVLDNVTGQPSEPISSRGPDRSQGADADFNGPNNEPTAWDCNDSGHLDDRRLTATMLTVDVPEEDNEFWLSVTFMESDHWDYSTTIKFGIQMAGIIIDASYGAGGAIALVAAKVATFIDEFKAQFKNNDDVLGVVHLHFRGGGTGVTVREHRADRGATVIYIANEGMGVELRGDGSRYIADIKFYGVGPPKHDLQRRSN